MVEIEIVESEGRLMVVPFFGEPTIQRLFVGEAGLLSRH